MLPIQELLPLAASLAVAGTVAGLLAGAFGVGGGAILVPVFYQVFGIVGVPESVAMHLAIGTSLAVIVPTSLRSYFAHRKRGAVDDRLLVAWITAVPIGALLAAAVVALASSETLRGIFAVLAVVVGLRMLFNRVSWKLGDDLPPNPFRWFVGVLIGLLSGLMGIGGGILTNTFMTMFGRPVHQAVATSSGVGVLISIPGLVGYVLAGWGAEGLPVLSTGYVNWVAVAVIIPITLLVAPLGVALAHRLGKRQLEVAFGIFLMLVALRFFLSLAG